ncbi:DNA translocase FtsK [Bacillus sp. 31A1R]|uniref:DNA translocase FtsK n=1 Tax=Robertmurraya mangrovi TaxID=3098077 RepID=A0ABU5IZJ0_9BACI|nr:DNA translocase FtsK [Bacillus sp. 31A1R]MDZ5472557.1 DNA translocase FtsK [Bacillus sp. 31A1R]
MSWIKKLFHMFKNEEQEKHVEYIEESFEEMNIEKSEITTITNKQKQKDVDARIAYQYPKGQFRFPLIPDEAPKPERRERKRERQLEQTLEDNLSLIREGTQRDRTRLRQETPRQVQETPAPRVKEVRPNREKRIESVEPPKRRQAEEKQIVKPNYSKRPFRPTEIPSPIYGYEKRPVKKVEPEVVEFELNHFEEDDVSGVEVNHLDVNSDSKNHEMEQNTNSQQHISEKSIVVNSKVEEFANHLLEENHLQESLIQAEENEENLEPVNETPLLELLHSENEVIETYKEFDVPVQHLETEIEFQDETLEIDSQNMDEEASNEHIGVKEEAQPSIEIIENNHVEENEFENNNIVELSPPPTKRNHLPFNVLMLKEDRRKLEQRKLLEIERQRITGDNQIQEFNQAPIEKPVLNEEVGTPFDPVHLEESSFELGEVVEVRATEESSQTFQATTLENELNIEIETASQALDEGESNPYYVFPSMDLLKPPVIVEENSTWITEQEHLLNETLKNFNVRASVVNVTQGPSVTRFEVQPEPGVKVNKITNLSDDIKLSLAAKDIRIEAPIPGKHTIGIEVPNQSSRPVLISEIINTPEFIDNQSPLTAVLGLDISGKPIVTDLRKMPHGLIAGATGSGKSVCINTILVSLLYKANPSELKLLLIDPKMVELAPYNQIPHLVSPVITDVKAATAALKWAVEEMERRYELFAHTGVRDINRFNEIAENHNRHSDKLPFIVIIIDELADLMMMSPADVEEAICRIAQKARACGIHLIIATQRPSVDVITGLIKANVPTRIAFSVSSQIDSRTIIDISGAERLLGRGDMLFLENGSSKPVRLQGTFVSDEEIDDVVAHARREQQPNYLFEQEELLKKSQSIEEEDELFFEACEFVIENGGASTSSLQRRFKIGYNRAARLIDMMQEQGYISEARGSKPRDVLITQSELESIQDTSTIS